MATGVAFWVSDVDNGDMAWFRTTDPVVTRLVDLGLEAGPARELSLRGTLLDLAAGTTLCAEGERGTQAFLLIEGEAKVMTDQGVIAVGPGAVVGEIATLNPAKPRNATVVAATDVLVLVFDVQTYRAMARKAELRPTLVPERLAA